MNDFDQIESLTDMVSASSRLSIGLAGLVYGLLPPAEYYKVEVLLEAHNDALEAITPHLFKDNQ